MEWIRSVYTHDARAPARVLVSELPLLGLGEDETESFAWRPAHHVTIGYDICISLFAQTAAFAGCSAGSRPKVLPRTP
jgi:hypothetical protein